MKTATWLCPFDISAWELEVKVGYCRWQGSEFALLLLRFYVLSLSIWPVPLYFGGLY
jgi:NADH:ubiquinone oxidoreductase subunit H